MSPDEGPKPQQQSRKLLPKIELHFTVGEGRRFYVNSWIKETAFNEWEGSIYRISGIGGGPDILAEPIMISLPRCTFVDANEAIEAKALRYVEDNAPPFA